MEPFELLDPIETINVTKEEIAGQETIAPMVDAKTSDVKETTSETESKTADDKSVQRLKPAPNPVAPQEQTLFGW